MVDNNITFRMGDDCIVTVSQGARTTWWCHIMAMLSALLALCGEPPPYKWPVEQSFIVSFFVRRDNRIKDMVGQISTWDGIMSVGVAVYM